MTQAAHAWMGHDGAPAGLRGVVRRRRDDKSLLHRGMIRVRTMSIWRATLIAFVGLAIAFGTALGVMTGTGAVLHTLNVSRHFDAYAALHDQVVVVCIIGLSFLWLLPPHPWAKELVEVPIRDDPELRFAEPVTGKARVAVVSVYQGRAPPLLRAGLEG
jgi:hypothetical protein